MTTGTIRHPVSGDAIGRVDVLTLPVDGSQHILSYGQGNDIVEKLKPKVIIPTHYLSETTSYTLTTLQHADEWVKSQKSYKMLDRRLAEAGSR